MRQLVQSEPLAFSISNRGTGIVNLAPIFSDIQKRRVEVQKELSRLDAAANALVDHFAAEPDLECARWERRIPLDQVLAYERYDPRWTDEEKTP